MKNKINYSNLNKDNLLFKVLDFFRLVYKQFIKIIGTNKATTIGRDLSNIIRGDSYVDYLHKHTDTSYSRVLTVHPTDKEAQFTTIEDAITVAIALEPTDENRVSIRFYGTLLISSTITIPSYCSLVGSSSKDSILKADGVSAVTILGINSNTEYRNFRVIGRYTSTNDIFINISTSYSDILLDNIIVDNCQYGFNASMILTLSNVNVKHCTFNSCGYPLRLVSIIGDNFVLENCTFYTTLFTYGILNYNTTGVVIRDTLLKGPYAIALRSYGGAAELDCYGCTIDGAIIAYQTDLNTAALQLIGCYAKNCTTDLKTLTSTNRIRVSGGIYDETKFSDISISPYTITGGYYDLDTEEWQDSRV